MTWMSVDEEIMTWRYLEEKIFFSQLRVLIYISRKPVRYTEKLLNMIFKEKIHQTMQSLANCTQYKTELVLVKV